MHDQGSHTPTPTPPPITPAKVVVSLLLLITAGLVFGLFMVASGTTEFWLMLGGAIIAGAASLLIPIKPTDRPGV